MTEDNSTYMLSEEMITYCFQHSWFRRIIIIIIIVRPSHLTMTLTSTDEEMLMLRLARELLIIVRKSCAHVNLTLSSIVQRSGLSKTKSRQADIHYGAVSKDTRWISRRHKVDASGRVRTRVLLIPRRTRCHGATVTPKFVDKYLLNLVKVGVLS